MMNNTVMDQQAFTFVQHFQRQKERYLATLSNEATAMASIQELNNLFIRANGNGIPLHPAILVIEDEICEFLRIWRCESPLTQAYSVTLQMFLRSLTIFEKLEVPLFIDNYGKKITMSDCMKAVNEKNSNCGPNPNASQGLPQQAITIGRPLNLTSNDRQTLIEIEEVNIGAQTPIVHVTHFNEADQIARDLMFKPSNNKNIIEGIWFVPKYQLSQYGNPPSSVYGSCAFETTLAELGVSGLRQGEIVSYKKEVNVILYASGTIPPNPLLKPTDDGVKVVKNDPRAYVHVSIFVPSKFLQIQGVPFQSVVRRPYFIHHGPFCVKALRNFTICSELTVSTTTQLVPPATSLPLPAQETIPGTAPRIVPDTTQGVALGLPQGIAPCPPQGIAPCHPQGTIPGTAPRIVPGTTKRVALGPPQGMAPCPPQGMAPCPPQGMAPCPPQWTIPRTAPRIVPGTTERVALGPLQGMAPCPPQGMAPCSPQGTIPGIAPRIVPGTTERVALGPPQGMAPCPP